MLKYLKNKNVILIYIYSFLSTFLLFRACDTLYYLSKGISSSKYVFFYCNIFHNIFNNANTNKRYWGQNK